MSVVIRTENLARTFRSYEKPAGLISSIRGFWDRKYTEKQALAPTTIEIKRGELVGLVGANGAGKTTFLKILSGLIHPTSGDAHVLGFRPWERDNDFLRRMSILLGQKNQLWWDISPLDSFAMLAEIYDIDKKTASQRAKDLAQILDCEHVVKTQLRRLSLGERMKMEIIGALLHEPDVLFLDEPTIGLDIVAQTSIRHFLTDYVHRKQPTVILTSHYMDDIAKLSNRLLLISHGNMVYDGTVEAFVKKTEQKQKLSFWLSEPLAKPISISDSIQIAEKSQECSFQVQKEKLSSVLSTVTKLPGIQDIKIEEADFEDIIRTFLEKESRILSPRRHNQP